MKKASLKHRLHEIIYEADTPAGKVFDIALLALIVFSVILVILESVVLLMIAKFRIGFKREFKSK